jgi:hypothetical protein
MLSDVYLGTNDLERATAFYDAVLKPLGMQRCTTHDAEWDRTSAGWRLYEDDGARELALWVGIPFNQQPATTGNGTMVAFGARSWKAVEDFHAAALLHGGTCEGTIGRLAASRNRQPRQVRRWAPRAWSKSTRVFENSNAGWPEDVSARA